MNWNSLFDIFPWIVGLSMIGQLSTHFYLEYQNTGELPKQNPQFIHPRYLLPYKGNVAEALLKVQQLNRLLFKLFIISLTLWFVLGFISFFYNYS
jgi:hypothetical protein